MRHLSETPWHKCSREWSGVISLFVLVEYDDMSNKAKQDLGG